MNSKYMIQYIPSELQQIIIKGKENRKLKKIQIGKKKRKEKKYKGGALVAQGEE